MEPVYERIEFCRNAETLWGKMKEGRWDWLGVHPNGQYVLGSPRRRGVITDHASATLTKAEAQHGQHGIRIHAEPNVMPSEQWFGTPEEADEAFEQKLAELKADAEKQPILAYMQRIEARQPVRVEWVESRPPTYR